MDRIQLFGLSIDRVSMDEALGRIDEFIAERTPRHIVTLDSSMIVIAREDAALHQIVANADMITPDGVGVVWASRLLGKPIEHRVSGVDLVAGVCERSERCGISVYFLGAAPGVADEAAENLKRKFPGARIVGTRHGFFAEADEPQIVADIASRRPDVLFVAFGIPKQEKFIQRHKAEMNVPVSIGIGGSFDVHSGRVQRAPVWMQKAGLEWLFRLMQNPKKIGKVMTLPRFALLALRLKLSGKS